MPCCGSSSSYSPCGLRVIQQVQDIVHEVVFVRILLVLEASLESLLEDRHDVCSISCRYELKRALDLFEEFVAAMNCLFLQIYLVGNADAGDVGALVSHLRVPVPQVCVGDFARHVENHDADVRTEVVGGVKLVEGLLAGRIPDICTASNAKLIRKVRLDRRAVPAPAAV